MSWKPDEPLFLEDQLAAATRALLESGPGGSRMDDRESYDLARLDAENALKTFDAWRQLQQLRGLCESLDIELVQAAEAGYWGWRTRDGQASTDNVGNETRAAVDALRAVAQHETDVPIKAMTSNHVLIEFATEMVNRKGPRP